MLHGESVVVLLPGIPREMREIFDSGVVDLLARRFHGDLRPAFHRTFHTSGIPESRLAEIIRGRLPPDISPVSLEFLPHVGGVRLRLTARGVENPEEAEALLDGVQTYLDPVLGSYGYEAESGELSEAVGRALSASGLTLAVAESCTGGLVAKGLTDHPGSSAYFLGGIVAYEDSVKTSLLGVSRELLEEGGAVSEGVATAMARGVARALGSNAGLGITGVAGPGGGTDEKPVGTVSYAAYLDGEDVVRTTRFLGDRQDVRNRAAAAALLLLHGLLEERYR
jgi:nicotinamide-nucleotide amidase